MGLCWRKIRIANIPEKDRDIFERYGESIIQNVVVGGFSPGHESDLKKLYGDEKRVQYAADWLTERADTHERRENRLETVEWAILIIFLFSLVVESIQLIHELGLFK